MSVMRVFVFETPEPRATVMKHFRGQERLYKKAKRDKNLKSYRLVETDNRWMGITEFDTKAKLNKFVKLIAADRKAIVSDSGGQGWSYIGTVRGGG